MIRLPRGLAPTALAIGLLATASTPVAAVSPDTRIVTKAGPVTLAPGGGFQTVASMAIPVANHWVTATATLDASSESTAGTGEIVCRTTGSNNLIDQARFALDGQLNGRSTASLFLNGAFGAGGLWIARLECQNGLNFDVQVTDIVLSALQTNFVNSPVITGNTNGLVSIPAGSTFRTVGSVDIPKGRWWIVAKTTLANGSSSSANDVNCRVKLSSTDLDRTSQGLDASPGPGHLGQVALQVAQVFSSPGKARLQCRGSQSASADNTRIFAIKAGKLTRRQLGGSASTGGTGTPRIISAYRAGSSSVPVGSLTTVAKLALPAGSWFVSAKASLRDSSATKVLCALSLEESSDAHFSRGAPGLGATGLYFQVAAVATASTTVFLECRSDTAGPTMGNIHITAIKAGAMDITALD
jgi:hypothetical protein